MKEQIKQWADELRSGKFTQSIGKLQNKNGHCCLGVACEVFIPEEEKLRTAEGVLMGSQSSSPRWLLEAGIEFSRRTGVGLSGLNDQYGYSFVQIADILERVFINEERVRFNFMTRKFEEVKQ